MSRPDYDATIDYHWVTTIADKAAPTVAEVNAGTCVTPSMVPDTYGYDQNESSVDQRALSTKFEGKSKGTWGRSGEIMLFGNDDDTSDDDAAVELFQTHGAAGFVVEVLHPATAGEATAGDLCNVYPAEASVAALQKGAPNTKQKYKVTFDTTEEPALRVAVAA